MPKPIREIFSDPDHKSGPKFVIWENKYGPSVQMVKSWKDKASGEWRQGSAFNYPELRALAAKIPEVLADMEVLDAEYGDQRREFFEQRARSKRDNQPTPSQQRIWADDDDDQIPF